MPLRILHCHSTFSLGGKEARAVRLMNAFGDAARHTVLSAMPDALGARDAILPGIRVDFPTTAPSLQGKPGLARYRALASYMQRFDLILTYNWGAMDAVMARRTFYKDVPPLVHHEDGFNADEADKLKTERNLFRRLALPAAHTLVVPSITLETIARRTWHQPERRIQRIANGIDLGAYAKPGKAAIPGLRKRSGEIVVGTLAGLRAVKNLARLVRVAATVPNVRLVIVGEGPERDVILAEAHRTGMTDRLTLPGFLANPHRLLGHFDIFALSSDSEQAPISVIEAMASGLPVVATNVGDVAAMVSDANRPAIVSRDDDTAFAAALQAMAVAEQARRDIGAANRIKAAADFDEQVMIGRYARLYEAAAGRPGALPFGSPQKVKHFSQGNV